MAAMCNGEEFIGCALAGVVVIILVLIVGPIVTLVAHANSKECWEGHVCQTCIEEAIE